MSVPGEGGCYIQPFWDLRFTPQMNLEAWTFVLNLGLLATSVGGLHPFFLRSHHDRCFFDSEIFGFLAILLGDVSTNCSLDALGCLDGRFWPIWAAWDGAKSEQSRSPPASSATYTQYPAGFAARWQKLAWRQIWFLCECGANRQTFPPPTR